MLAIRATNKYLELILDKWINKYLPNLNGAIFEGVRNQVLEATGDDFLVEYQVNNSSFEITSDNLIEHKLDTSVLLTVIKGGLTSKEHYQSLNITDEAKEYAYLSSILGVLSKALKCRYELTRENFAKLIDLPTIASVASEIPDKVIILADPIFSASAEQSIQGDYDLSLSLRINFIEIYSEPKFNLDILEEE